MRFFCQQFKYPVWLNADILKGPGAAKEPSVDATAFLSQAKAFGAWTLSVGWTTTDNGTDPYTQDDVVKMNSTLIANSIQQQPVTFAVRAAIASRSDAPMKSLVNVLNSEWRNQNRFFDSPLFNIYS